MVKKIYNWMTPGSRWKHLLLGVAIGAVANDAYCAFLTGTCTVGAMEVKDLRSGGKFNWLNLVLAMSGVVVGHLIRYVVWGM